MAKYFARREISLDPERVPGIEDFSNAMELMVTPKIKSGAEFSVNTTNPETIAMLEQWEAKGWILDSTKRV